MTGTTSSEVRPHAAAAHFLSGVDARWRALVTLVGPCAHDPKAAREPYEALVRAIAYQQLHAKAGDAILSRLKALVPDRGFPSPTDLLTLDEPTLRSCGFSAAKGATIRAIANGAVDGLVPDRIEADRLPNQTLIDRLTALKGIGRWTVEMLLIYSLDRADVMPADDFGVREGYRRFMGLAAKPSARALRAAAEAWTPYRTFAAWYLWRAAERLPSVSDVP